MPRHQPSLTHPCTTGIGGRAQHAVEVRDKVRREGGDGENGRGRGHTEMRMQEKVTEEIHY